MRGNGCIAQLVEQLTLNQRVAGSSPARLTSLLNTVRLDKAYFFPSVSKVFHRLADWSCKPYVFVRPFAQFLKEKQFLANISPKTVRSFQQALNAYQRVLAGRLDTNGGLPNKHSLKDFVIGMRKAELSPGA